MLVNIMKKHSIFTGLLALVLMMGLTLHAAEESSPKSDLQALVMKIQGKLQEGVMEESAYESELKEFDGLIEKYKDQKTGDVAQISLMKAMLYIEVFKNMDKALPLLESVEKNFPETDQGKMMTNIIPQVKRQMEVQKRQAHLQPGKEWPDFEAKDLSGKPLSVGKFKGKVVLVDFWATWCGPCVAELPNVKKAYAEYHDAGFEIIGVSLDNKREALDEFLKKNKMSWPQTFDGKGWENEIAGQYGIQSIPATFLIGPDGKIIARDLRGPALEKAVAAALKK